MVNNIHHPIQYKYVNIEDVNMFYREAGEKNLPTLLLLHGFPSSSHQFRELIPLLADKFHLIAPDFPGFGFTEVKDTANYIYSFDSISKTLIKFVDALNLKKYAMYIFDYGAPIGFRLALTYPERVTGFVSQNGNAYLEGLGSAWDPIKAYWDHPTEHNRKIIEDAILNLEGTRGQYIHGVPSIESIAPESYYLDTFLFERGANKSIQLDLFLDYKNNLKMYPLFQQFFRDYPLPCLIIWGKHDLFFIPAGAEAYKKDNAHAVVELLDTGHFALETHVEYIAKRIREVILK
ncbi:alpha/beta hydrolase [Gilliamella sp. B14448G11]|uniref:alpha/beta fold hydrolase n=1 Tax=unclassified Gilliamella TaxID=2685620 RepID=UPI0018DE28AF|nr:MULTISPECIES: alpha/beta hydrolase [unclassified Gilliamella]MBI0028688.1 alpha/beta hydrolase [Gilliamella sp. B14448G7]MBI0035375.1 alpha/beta hydrolase [Gilliamella sp. B14448G11]MBI0042592.1 alpha/beta hydrolase [Gilliamella sp. B14448G12]